MSHNPHTPVILGVILAALGGTPDARAQQPRFAFLSVVDSSGAPVTNLDASQVSMTFNGVACTPVTLTPIAWPTKVIVLVDNGPDSVDALSTLREGLHRFVGEMPDGIEASLVTLAPQPRSVVRPTTDRQEFFRGIDLVVQDRGAPKFLEGLAEAADRIDKEKGDVFYTIMMIVINGPESSGGDLQGMFNRLRDKLARHPVTVHAVMLSISTRRTTDTSAGSPVRGSVNSRAGLALRSTGALQTQVSAGLANGTGGRYENIAAVSNLQTLLPEYGQQIARSALLQSHQYRVSCQPPTAKASQMSVFTSYPGARGVAVTRDGHIP